MKDLKNEFPKLNNYTIEKEIGRGSYATVYLGIHKILNIQVAIKHIVFNS